MRDTKKIRVTLDLSVRDHQRLEEIVEFQEAASKAEALRNLVRNEHKVLHQYAPEGEAE